MSKAKSQASESVSIFGTESAGGIVVLDSSTSTTFVVGTSAIGHAVEALNITAGNIENAVYGHVRAIRALGRTVVDSHQIARVLDLPPAAVTQALRRLSG